MGKKFKHLTWNDRLIIERMILKGYHKKAIADAIGCSLRTVYYELSRARYIHTLPDLREEERYSPDIAHNKYRKMLKKKGKKAKLLQDKKLCNYISHMLLDLKYSPEAILLEIRQNKALNFDTEIKSVNTIYAAIIKGYIPGVTMESLPRKGRKLKHKKYIVRNKKLPPGISIEKRPEEVNYRCNFGHWEMDSVIGKNTNNKTLLVFTERKTRFEIIEPMKAHTTYEVVKALNRLEKRFKSKFYSIFKTITVDNGSEFKNYNGMEKALYRKGRRTNVYYCHARSPQERGSNENNNILIRRFFPKGMDFDTDLKKKEVKAVEYWINSYPRGIFDGYTAGELFKRELYNLGYLQLE